jgi:DNA-binding NtrC family response regulator
LLIYAELPGLPDVCAWNYCEADEVAKAELPIVLIVEDDLGIQAIVDEALIEAGFETAIAASAEEAVTLLKGKVANYRALVTDITLKGTMTGWQIAQAAREIDPTFPIVYITGAAGGDWPSHGVPNSILLEKPFAAAQLVTAVSQLLNASPPIG